VLIQRLGTITRRSCGLDISRVMRAYGMRLQSLLSKKYWVEPHGLSGRWTFKGEIFCIWSMANWREARLPDLDDNAKMAEALNKYGINLADVVQDTNADTMIRVAQLTEETFELAIKINTLKRGEKIDERMFKRKGELSTLYGKIEKAKKLNLLDEVAYKDSHLLRRIRNKFAHRSERLHFDSPGVVELVKQLSTYKAAEFNQDAILAADSNVIEQLKAKK
jgi:hypothetical protein